MVIAQSQADVRGALGKLSAADMIEAACARDPGLWAEVKLGYSNAPFHAEWYELQRRYPRLAVVAPREHAKSEVFTVVSTAHRAIYVEGSWQAVFAQTAEQSKLLLGRIMDRIGFVRPDLLESPPKWSTTDVILSNWSRITVGGAGMAMRGWHPDRIVGDDVLDEASAESDTTRRRMSTWWFGTVAPMAHPGTWRRLGWGMRIGDAAARRNLWYPPTRIVLVGTPFHQLDLLLTMKDNPVWKFVRYDAEFDPHDLVDGMYAVEVS